MVSFVNWIWFFHGADEDELRLVALSLEPVGSLFELAHYFLLGALLIGSHLAAGVLLTTSKASFPSLSSVLLSHPSII